MSNVVALRVVPKASAYSEAFEEAWKAYPELGRIRSSRKEAAKVWSRVVREVGEVQLVAAVRRYVAEDKEHKRECGPPGFHRWLAWGRYEHWIGGPAQTLDASRFPNEAVRLALVAATNEAFAGAYLDRCQVEGTTLIARTGVAVTRLLEHRALFRSLGFTGIRKAAISCGQAPEVRTDGEQNAFSGGKSRV